MNCPTCGTGYEDIYTMGQVTPVTSIPRCSCAVNVSMGFTSSGTTVPAGGTFTITNPAPVIHLPAPKLVANVECVLCGDVIPIEMSTVIGDGEYCPTCYDTPPPDPNKLIADLLDLQEELRPSRDGE